MVQLSASSLVCTAVRPISRQRRRPARMYLQKQATPKKHRIKSRGAAARRVNTGNGSQRRCSPKHAQSHPRLTHNPPSFQTPIGSAPNDESVKQPQPRSTSQHEHQKRGLPGARLCALLHHALDQLARVLAQHAWQHQTTTTNQHAHGSAQNHLALGGRIKLN